MKDSWEDIISYLEMGDDDFFIKSHMNSSNEEEFLTDIIHQQPVFTPESGSPSPYPSSSVRSNPAAAIADHYCGAAATGTMDTSLDGHGTLLKSNNSSNSTISLEKPATSPKAYILSFDDSVAEQATRKRYSKHDSAMGYPKRRPGNHSFEPGAQQGTKKVRNSSETLCHIMAERKRRQEVTGNIIALSATIPGLKKTDKAYVLREAVIYVKELQDRIRELENQNRKRCVDSIICIKKSKLCTNEATTSCETNSDGWHRCIEALPEIEARVLEKEVLIGIHCYQTQRDDLLKIFSFLKNLHLSATSSSLLPFGTCTVKLTIIAQMDGEYNMPVDDLIKSLRQHLLKSHDMQE